MVTLLLMKELKLVELHETAQDFLLVSRIHEKLPDAVLRDVSVALVLCSSLRAVSICN